jgi:hypothetical protein
MGLFVLSVFDFFELFILFRNPIRWIAANDFLPFCRLFHRSDNCFLWHVEAFLTWYLSFVISYSYFLSYVVLFRKSLLNPYLYAFSLWFPLVVSKFWVLNMFGHLCWESGSCSSRGLFLGPSTVSHWSTCLFFVSIPCCFHYHGSIV